MVSTFFVCIALYWCIGIEIVFWRVGGFHLWLGGRLHAPMHTFQKSRQKTSGGHERRGLRQCAKKAPFRHTGKKHATLGTLSMNLVGLTVCMIGVDMNQFVGDYGFVVINGDLKAKEDHCMMGRHGNR